jgi:phage terminase large subunit-like protein
MSSATLAEAKLERLRQLKELQAELKRLRDVEDGAVKRPWVEMARPEQLPPDGDWFCWLILAGRGWGKSRTAVEWSMSKARRYPGCRIAIVARTIADSRDTVIEGDSGLLTAISRDEYRGHTEDDGYNRSMGEIFLANGSRFKTFTSEKPWRLRGPQFNFALADEAAFWEDAHKGLIADTTWQNLAIATRLPKRPEWDNEYRTQIVVATTPRPVALLKTNDPDPSRTGLMQRENTIITRGRTSDNLANLSESYKQNVVIPLLGTRLGRQELDAELLEDNEGALWKREWIDETRITDPKLVPDLIRIVVGVDPAVTDGESSAQTGVIVAGAGKNGRGYVLGDFTLRASPMEAMKKVVEVYHAFDADRIVAEVNQGGDYIGMLLKTVDPDVPYSTVRATRGKAIRAEPVSSLYEQRRISHVGSFPYLEDSMCFIAGTKITTTRGNVNIEDVTHDDLVLTRAGWRRVNAAGCTGVRDTVTVHMSNGVSVTCTPDHPVFVVGKNFTPASQLTSRDRIITCIETLSHDESENHRSHSSTTMVNGITSGLVASTTALLVHVERGFFTATSMKTHMARYLMAGSSTMLTTTEKITTSATSKLCQNMITSHTTNKTRSLECTPFPVNSKDEVQRKAGKNENNASSLSSAWNVAALFGLQACEPRFAHVNVGGVTVLSVQENVEPSTVYNLSVDNQPEYFANGILVHNCQWTPLDKESPDRLDALVWSIFSLKDLIGGSFLSAYGVIRCEKCQSAFTINDPGTKKPRTSCPKCAAPVESQE